MQSFPFGFQCWSSHIEETRRGTQWWGTSEKKQQKKKKRRKQFKGSHFSKKHDDFNKARRPRLSVGWIMKLPNWKSSFTICSAVKCHDKHTGEKQHREWKWRNVNLHLHGVVKLFYFFFLVCLFFRRLNTFTSKKRQRARLIRVDSW